MCLNVQRRCRRTARPNTGRNVRPAIEYCNVIGLILGLSNNGSRWVFGPPSLLLTYIYIDLRPAYGVGTVRVASAALQYRTVLNYVQYAVPVWRLLWYGLAYHWTVIRGTLTVFTPS